MRSVKGLAGARLGLLVALWQADQERPAEWLTRAEVARRRRGDVRARMMPHEVEALEWLKEASLIDSAKGGSPAGIVAFRWEYRVIPYAAREALLGIFEDCGAVGREIWRHLDRQPGAAAGVAGTLIRSHVGINRDAIVTAMERLRRLGIIAVRDDHIRLAIPYPAGVQ